MLFFIYKCTECGREYKRDEVTYLCHECEKNYLPGNPLRGVLRVEFDYADLNKSFKRDRNDLSLFMPLEREYFPLFPVGNTPFSKAEVLGDYYGVKNLYLKNDGLNPTGSLKDRASWLVVGESKRLGINEIITASTGNAASSLSAICAAEGKKAVIYLPASAPKAKIIQNVLYGAEVIPLNGTYDEAFKLSLRHTEEKGGLNRNTAYNPLTIEGKKTVGLEIFIQNNYKVPDVIIVSVGDGVIISGVYKAFYDLLQSKITDKLPRLVCVQAENSAAIHNYFTSGEYRNLSESKTIADSISVNVPSNAFMAKEVITASNGISILISEEEILRGQKILAEKTGVFAEPSSALIVSALGKLNDSGFINSNDQVVLLITGNGLKDIETPMKNIIIPETRDLKL